MPAKGFTHICRFLAILSLIVTGAACDANLGADDNGDDELRIESQSAALEAIDELVFGDYICYMVRAYYPKDALNAMLPRNFSIPDDDVMTEYYPDTELRADSHPFVMNFCHGSNIHDIISNVVFPEQEEILPMFPVTYTHDDGTEHLCSYVPSLYLDSFVGVLGGLLWGLRKEYHAQMKHETTATTDSWTIDGIIEASFEKHTNSEMAGFHPFIDQTYSNPMVTISYPMPFTKMVVYDVRVYPTIVMEASETFSWNYKGATVTQSDDELTVYSEYTFSMSSPLSSKQYFN